MMPSIVADRWRRVNDLLALDGSASRNEDGQRTAMGSLLPSNGR
jgi:hypothetical protein